MATTFKSGGFELTVTANQSFPTIPTPQPNQAVGERDNGDQYAERTRPGTRYIHRVIFEQISNDEYDLLIYFFSSVVDWHRVKFEYKPPWLDGEKTVWLAADSFNISDYTNDFFRLEFNLIEVV